MKLKPISFYCMHLDGLVLTDGHAFDVVGRQLVVHKERPPFCRWDQTYKISELTVGMAVPIAPTRDRQVAVCFAREVVSAITDQQWNRALRIAGEYRKQLKIVEPGR